MSHNPEDKNRNDSSYDYSVFSRSNSDLEYSYSSDSPKEPKEAEHPDLIFEAKKADHTSAGGIEIVEDAEEKAKGKTIRAVIIPFNRVNKKLFFLGSFLVAVIVILITCSNAIICAISPKYYLGKALKNTVSCLEKDLSAGIFDSKINLEKPIETDFKITQFPSHTDIPWGILQINSQADKMSGQAVTSIQYDHMKSIDQSEPDQSSFQLSVFKDKKSTSVYDKIVSNSWIQFNTESFDKDELLKNINFEDYLNDSFFSDEIGRMSSAFFKNAKVTKNGTKSFTFISNNQKSSNRKVECDLLKITVTKENFAEFLNAYTKQIKNDDKLMTLLSTAVAMKTGLAPESVKSVLPIALNQIKGIEAREITINLLIYKDRIVSAEGNITLSLNKKDYSVKFELAFNDSEKMVNNFKGSVQIGSYKLSFDFFTSEYNRISDKIRLTAGDRLKFELSVFGKYTFSNGRYEYNLDSCTFSAYNEEFETDYSNSFSVNFSQQTKEELILPKGRFAASTETLKSSLKTQLGKNLTLLINFGKSFTEYNDDTEGEVSFPDLNETPAEESDYYEKIYLDGQFYDTFQSKEEAGQYLENHNATPVKENRYGKYVFAKIDEKDLNKGELQNFRYQKHYLNLYDSYYPGDVEQYKDDKGNKYYFQRLNEKGEDDYFPYTYYGYSKIYLSAFKSEAEKISYLRYQSFSPLVEDEKGPCIFVIREEFAYEDDPYTENSKVYFMKRFDDYVHFFGSREKAEEFVKNYGAANVFTDVEDYDKEGNEIKAEYFFMEADDDILY